MRVDILPSLTVLGKSGSFPGTREDLHENERSAGWGTGNTPTGLEEIRVKGTGVRFLLLLLVVSLCSACGLSTAARKQATYHYDMGASSFAEGNMTGALVEFTAAEKYTPDDPELLYYLGRVYFAKKKFAIAEQKYLRSLAIKPDNPAARNDLGVNYLDMRRWDDAIQQFKLVANDLFASNQEAATINLGIAYYEKGDYPRAIDALRTAVSNNPREPRAHLHLGKVYAAIGKYELALEEFKKSTELDKNYATAYYQLGLTQMKLKDTKGARDSFRAVQRIAPDSELGQSSKDFLNVLK